MQSLYAQFMEERENKLVYETKKGFITYCFSGDECYIESCYVIPAFRKKGVAANMANIVAESARAAGCKFMTCTVCPRVNGATDSLKAFLAYGFELVGVTADNLVILKKNL